MKLKVDADGHVVVQDGKPVYVKDDGTDVAFDVVATTAKITQLNGEAMGHRQRAEAAEEAIKPFKDIDPVKAKKALETVKNLDDKQLVDAGQVEVVRTEAIRATEEKYKPVELERDTLRTELYNERIGGSFARSKFGSEKLAIPADIAQATFGKHFEVKDGKTIAKDASGNVIYSDSNPGTPADFEEAYAKLVNQYPNKDAILKGSGHQGGGSQPPGSGTQPPGSTGDMTGSQRDRQKSIGQMFPDLPAR